MYDTQTHSKHQHNVREEKRVERVLCGINVNEEGNLCGDVAFDEAEPIVDAITPVPGGVGGVTTSILVEHVVNAALLKMEASEK